MIELIQAPDTNRVIADGNDTIIQVRTTNGQDHFLRAIIYINGVEFLQQGWSKDEENVCSFNLKHLYLAYFSNEFSENIISGFRTKNDLFKKVKIVTREYKVGSPALVSSLTLPEFFIIKNLKPQVFDDSKTVQFLDLPQENINVSKTAGFVFPLYIKAGDLLTVQVLNELGVVIYSETLANYPTQLTQYEMNFVDFPLQDLTKIFVKFSTSQHQVQKKLVFIKESIYPAKQIFYLNNCGFYLTAFLLGQKENNNSLSPRSYFQFDGTEVTYNVEDVKELKLSSGYGYKDITSLIHSIAISVDVRLHLDGYWERVKSETKKIQTFVDNQFIYSEALNFSRVNVANFTNSNTFVMIPEVVDITKTGDENASITISKNDFLNSYTATQSATRLRIRTLPVNGKISYQTADGIFNLSDMAANNPSIIPFTIPLEAFVSIIYQPDYTLFGDPLDTFNFELGPPVLWSNIGNLIMNVNDVADANLPPNIVVNTIQEVVLDANGDGTKNIDAGITDPEGDAVSILWEVISGPVTFNDPTFEKPTVTVTAGATGQNYQIKVTATDTANNLVSEKFLKVLTSTYKVGITSLAYPPTGDNINGREQIFDINLEGGKPLNAVILSYKLQSISFDQYAVINLNESTERILTGNTFYNDRIFPGPDGTRTLQVKVYNAEPNTVLDVTVRIESVEGDQIISDELRQTILSL